MSATDEPLSGAPLRPGFLPTTDERLAWDYYGRWNELRDESPVFRSDAAAGWSIWYLLDFDQARIGLSDYERFSSRSIAPPHVPDVPRARYIPEELDPPEHTAYRRLLSKHFTPNRIALLEPKVVDHAQALIDAIASAGHCDFVAEFAEPFPTKIFLELLGLPIEDAPLFQSWMGQLMHRSPSEDPPAYAAAVGELTAYLEAVIAARRRSPRDDLVSELLADEMDGRRLDPDELRRICHLLFMAGLDTVSGALTMIWRHLAEHPEDRQAIRARPEHRLAAVDELLRLFSIVSLPRIVCEDVEFAGCPMKKGDRIVASMVAGNRDPKQFHDPDQFVIDRRPNRHIAFGAGAHRCLGAHLARLELRVALELWHTRIPDYRIGARDQAPVRTATVAGLAWLELEW